MDPKLFLNPCEPPVEFVTTIMREYVRLELGGKAYFFRFSEQGESKDPSQLPTHGSGVYMYKPEDSEWLEKVYYATRSQKSQTHQNAAEHRIEPGHDQETMERLRRAWARAIGREAVTA